MITYEQIRKNEDIKAYIEEADASLLALGYTEHSYAHVCRVAEEAARILRTLGHDEHTQELAKIAGYLHDIGNLVNRIDHSQSGAVMAFRILDKLGMPARDIGTIVSAIGNHDEGTGVPVNELAAALILADKSDVRRSRVRNYDRSTFDIHDSVNYSVKHSHLDIDSDNITLVLDIDTEYGSVMDYFEIFLGRMLLCKKAADKLGMHFRLEMNGQSLL
jgi:putative nucleotidyltransferase with HDIG domain